MTAHEMLQHLHGIKQMIDEYKLLAPEVDHWALRVESAEENYRMALLHCVDIAMAEFKQTVKPKPQTLGEKYNTEESA